MPESSNNNTNELSAGSGVGLNGFSNYTSRALDIARSRGNYQTAIKDDKQLQAFREIVYKMVSTWLYEDKIRIVAEYGDSEYLSKNPKEKDLNAVCTESLIIHLPKSDLQKLVADTRAKENQLRKEVKEATKNRDAAATAAISSSFTYNSPMDYAKTTDPNKIEEIIRTADRKFKIPKDIKRQFSGLAKELKEVLDECYSGMMLAALGHRMNLEINIDDDELKESIINKTILYVALVTGVSKSTAMQNAFVTPEPYNELLHFTTYSYLTGEPGMDMNTWKKLRDSARTAKKQAEIFAKMRKDRARTGSAAYKALSGGVRSARKIGENDIGILKNATMDELITLAGKYGIETKNKDIGKVKKELYRAMAANSQAIEKANTRIAFAQDRGKMPQQSDMDIVSIRGAGVYSKGLRDAVDENGNLPIVRFSQNGVRLTERIVRAVPVYVVGNGGRYGGNALVQGTQTKLYGMENDKMAIIGNAHDTAAERKSTLQGKDLAMFSKIMCATDEELAEFEQKTLRERYSVRADILTSNANRSSYMRRAYDIWMYADSSSSKVLLDYAEKNMGVKKLTNYLDHTVVGRSIKAATYAIKDMGKAIVAPIRNTVQAIKNLHTVIHGKNIANFNELTESAQEFYYAESSRIRNYGDTDLYAQNELTASGWALQNKGDKWGTDRASLHAKGIDDEDFSKIYIMLKAYSSSQKMLANYLEGQLKKKYKDDFSIKNFGNGHRKRTAVKDFFTAPKRALSTIFGNRGTRTNADMDRNPFSEKAANPNLNGNAASRNRGF